MAKHKYTMEDWRAVRKGLDAGGTIRGVAAETGVDRGAVFRWSRRDRPPDWMWLEMEIPESPARRVTPAQRVRKAIRVTSVRRALRAYREKKAIPEKPARKALKEKRERPERRAQREIREMLENKDQ